jgi:F420-non-reducing hydrogenase iron-sulfur subunit
MILEDAGIDPDRFAIEWVSGAEGPRFAEKVTEFTAKIKALGPNRFNLKEVA